VRVLIKASISSLDLVFRIGAGYTRSWRFAVQFLAASAGEIMTHIQLSDYVRQTVGADEVIE
jgi:hypothetical protein